MEIEKFSKPFCLTLIFSTSGIRKLYTNSETISSDWKLVRLPTDKENDYCLLTFLV